MHQLGVQHRRSRRSAHGVVTQRDELPVEDRARAQTSDESGHAALALHVFARLRTVGFVHVNHGVLRRATFVVDPEGIIRFVYVTDLSVGRNPEEVIRVLDALQTDELCPCNWQKGEPVLTV